MSFLHVLFFSTHGIRNVLKSEETRMRLSVDSAALYHLVSYLLREQHTGTHYCFVFLISATPAAAKQVLESVLLLRIYPVWCIYPVTYVLGLKPSSGTLMGVRGLDQETALEQQISTNRWSCSLTRGIRDLLYPDRCYIISSAWLEILILGGCAWNVYICSMLRGQNLVGFVHGVDRACVGWQETEVAAKYNRYCNTKRMAKVMALRFLCFVVRNGE